MSKQARAPKVGEVLQELCIFGGLLATRQQVYEYLQTLRGPKGETLRPLALDQLAWQPDKATPEEIEYHRRVGLVFDASQPDCIKRP
jgi:hypothetical protein